MEEIFDDRPIDTSRLPRDGRGLVEFAPGFFVPAKRADELAQEILANPSVAEAIEEITAERCGDDPLTDELCVYVPFWFLAQIEMRLATALYLKSLETAAKGRRVHSVAGHLIRFGQ